MISLYLPKTTELSWLAASFSMMCIVPQPTSKNARYILTSRSVIKEVLVNLKTYATKTYTSNCREYAIPEISRILRLEGFNYQVLWRLDRFNIESDSVSAHQRFRIDQHAAVSHETIRYIRI